MGLLKRSGRPRGERFRVLFVTDLHASEVTFRKVLNAVGVYEADSLIVGGDLTGKQIVPLVEAGGGWSCDLSGTQVSAGEADVGELEAAIRNLGQYPVRMGRDRFDELTGDPVALGEVFEDACLAQVADWMSRLGDRLGGRTPVFVTGGNDDYLSIEPVIDRADWVVNAEGRVVELLPGVAMASTGYGNITPWGCPRDESEEALGARIEAMVGDLGDARRAVFNFHVPPFGSGLDRCMRLDLTVAPPRPIVGEETDAGSTAVREAVERHQPALSLHGHIHESRGVRRIGATQCVNPGSEYSEGVLNAAIVDFRGGELASVQLVAA
ncbi:MAG TPA: metallophosphoesterase [Solirubrobacteraceae bacterium]|jgi:Icc-related predicted phosphoesterase|nr:metallophosphoesterase [Solirubrobacteraceae bacterium]